jgi:manganese/zinc/iron transport system ATP- binding protein
MDAYAARQIDALSGGQKQRVFIARALMQEAQLYFLDEPFSGIDVASTQVILQLLKELQAEGKTLFVVHHDLNSVPALFDWVILLNMRLITSGPTAEVFSPEMIQRTYGKDSRLFDQASKLSKAQIFGYDV